MDFNWTVSGATLAVILGWVVTAMVQAFKRGGAETEQRQSLVSAHAKLDDIRNTWLSEKAAFDTRMREMESSRAKWREDIERSLDQRFGATSGAIQMLRDQQAEDRQNLAKNYMTKPEISAIETRVTDGQGRIIDRLEKLDNNIAGLQREVIAAMKASRS